MAVAFDVSSHSHASTAGNGSQSAASFSWSHAAASSGVKGALVVTYVANSGTDLTSSVTYGGTTMTAVTGGLCATSTAEAGVVKIYYLGASVPQGTQTVVVNRTNNATSMFAHAVTFTAGANTETFDLILQGNAAGSTQALAELLPQNGSNVDAMRICAAYSGLATVPSTGANSTLLESNLHPVTTAARSMVLVRETTAGQGARPVGVTGSADDVAAIFFAVREVVAESADITFDSLLTPITADSDTTLITTAILRAGNIGQDDFQSDGKTNAFTITGVTASSMTKDALQTNQGPIAAINIRNAGIISTSAGFKTLGLNHNGKNSYYSQHVLPSGNRLCTAAGCIYLDVPDQGASGNLFDFCGFFGNISGQFAMMQFCSGSGGAAGAYGFEIESNPVAPILHSSVISVPSTPALYWFSFQCDFTGGTASLYIYNYPAMTLVGNVTASQITGEDIDYCRFGQGEVGDTSPAAHKSFMWFGLDYTTHTQPLKFTAAGGGTVTMDMWTCSRADVVRRVRRSVPSGIIGIKA